MPYSIQNPPSAIKNKSTLAVAAGVKAANSALDRGLSEEEAIFAAISAANQVDKPKKTVEKKYENKIPLHLQAVLNKQVQIIEQEEIQKVNSTKELVKADFNDNNQLVLIFSDGSTVKSSPINIDNITQNISILAGNQQVLPTETNASFTYSNGLPIRVDYLSGNYKLFTYVNSVVTRSDYIVGTTTYRKDFYYNPDGTLDYIIESTI